MFYWQLYRGFPEWRVQFDRGKYGAYTLAELLESMPSSILIDRLGKKYPDKYLMRLYRLYGEESIQFGGEGFQRNIAYQLEDAEEEFKDAIFLELIHGKNPLEVASQMILRLIDNGFISKDV